MHPSQAGVFRRTMTVLLTIAFAGTLLLFTGQANLELLKTLYPNSNFALFGLLALEGGVVYWIAYYLMSMSGVHRALAVFAVGIDAIISGVGFFYEMEKVTNTVGTVQMPPIVIIVVFVVMFNVAMSIITHLLPSGMNRDDRGYSHVYSPTPLPPSPPPTIIDESPSQDRSLVPAELSQEAQGGAFMDMASSALATGMDFCEQAREKLLAKREARKPQTSPLAPSLQDEEQADQ